MRRLPIIVAVIAVIAFFALSSLFTVNEKQQALVLQFGEIKRTICGGNTGTERDYELAESCDVDGPGLYFKIPLIQEVAYYEDRILPLETDPLEVTPRDNRRLEVDAFARWRITDPVAFRQRAQSVQNADDRLQSILNAALRQVLGTVTSENV
ncbi:MAG: SPFH domain-containing protein, partial [Pseudomonadota bacterium]